MASLPDQYRGAGEPVDDLGDPEPGVDLGKVRRSDNGGVDPTS
jgi:hypothetical protein